MTRTYKAVLKGNRIEWSGESPACLTQERAVAVQVTVWEEEPPLPEAALNQGQRMAAALEQLASVHALSGITEPADWEREIRKDRPLPDREP